MKAASLQKSTQKLHLKVIKNEVKKKKSVKTKLNINTLIPNFKFTNSNGETATPLNRVLL
jgi:hypothetical protein